MLMYHKMGLGGIFCAIKGSLNGYALPEYLFVFLDVGKEGKGKETELWNFERIFNGKNG